MGPLRGCRDSLGEALLAPGPRNWAAFRALDIEDYPVQSLEYGSNLVAVFGERLAHFQERTSTRPLAGWPSELCTIVCTHSGHVRNSGDRLSQFLLIARQTL